MANMFKPKVPTPPAPQVTTVTQEVPKSVRMPFEQDPEVIAAGKRTREKAMRRSGRQSTILTDQAASGSSGQKLGG